MINILKKFFSKKRILILVGGNISKIEAFSEPAKELGLDVTLASFSDINFSSDYPLRLKIGDVDVKNFDVIYFRMVGRRLEEATLVANYAVANRVKIVDKLYEKSLFIPLSIIKSLEMHKLISAGLPIPKTIFGTLAFLEKNYPRLLTFPFVIKSNNTYTVKYIKSPI